MNITVTLDLSPAFAAAIQDLLRAFAGRGLPPLRPYEKPDWLNAFERQMGNGAKVPTATAPFVQVDKVADAEVRTAPAAAPPAEIASIRWTEERKALIRREYAGSTDIPDLHRRLNELPGAPIPHDIMRWWANREGLANPGRRGASRKAPAPVTAAAAPRADKPELPETPRSPAAAVAGVVGTDDATIRRWAAERGLCNGGEPLDLERINAKRGDLGLPLFVRANGLRASAATMRPVTGGVR